MTVKFCVKCGDPIHTPQLDNDEDERCECCGDHPQDWIESTKQEAYAAGWHDAIEERNREEEETR